MTKLNVKQQKLLNRYFDGETGWFCSLLAKRLLVKNTSAKKYFDQLKDMSVGVKNGEVKPDKELEDLWASVSSRIEQEERAEVYLGKRNQSTKQARKSWFANPYLVGGSAATCAFVLGMAFNLTIRQPKTQIANIIKAPQTQIQIPDQMHTRAIEVNSGPKANTNKLPNKIRLPRLVELDWVKSDGQVRLIPNPEGNSNILWVRKKVPIKIKAIPTRNTKGIKVLKDTTVSLND